MSTQEARRVSPKGSGLKFFRLWSSGRDQTFGYSDKNGLRRDEAQPEFDQSLEAARFNLNPTPFRFLSGRLSLRENRIPVFPDKP